MDIPLLVYSLNAALEANLGADIVVSTDHEEIRKLSTSHKVEVSDRPKHLSGDYISSYEVAVHIINERRYQGTRYDWIMLLQPTSPLRNANHIRSAYKLYQESKKLIVGVCEVEHHPYKMYCETSAGNIPVHSWSDFEKPRQLLPKPYRINGAMYLLPVEDLIANQSFIYEGFVPFIMDEMSSVDIDNYESLQYAEYLLSKKRSRLEEAND